MEARRGQLGLVTCVCVCLSGSLCPSLSGVCVFSFVLCRDVTPQQLDMEADEENLIETSLIEIQS